MGLPGTPCPVRPGNLQAVSGFGQESRWANISSFEKSQNNLKKGRSSRDFI